MWFGNYDENGINVGDVVYGVVTGACSAGIFLSLEDGQEAFPDLAVSNTEQRYRVPF